MSERERWIIYPLLFLTLGIALRNESGLGRKIVADRVDCSQLIVRNDKAKPQVVIDSTTAGGVVRVFDANRSMELVLGHEDRESSLFRESATPAGTETVALLGNLRQPSAADLLELMGHWPLLDPRLTRTHQPDSHAGERSSAAKPRHAAASPDGQ